jgi:hypothetical protein
MAAGYVERTVEDARMSDEREIKDYRGAAGGRGSMAGMAKIVPQEGVSPDLLDPLRRQNKPRGVMCVS